MNKDLRYQKTEQSIRQAFFTNLKTTSFPKLTVAQIIKTAIISRPTFYLHYQDKYDLLESIVREESQSFQNYIHQHIHHLAADDFLLKLGNKLASQQPQLAVLHDIHEPHGDLFDNYRVILYQELLEALESGNIAIKINLPKDYIADLYAAIGMTYLKYIMQGTAPEVLAPSLEILKTQFIISHK